MMKIKVVAENVASNENKEFSLGRPSGFSLHLLFCLFSYVLGLRLIYQDQAFESKCAFFFQRNCLILDHCLKNGRYRLPWLDILEAQMQESVLFIHCCRIRSEGWFKSSFREVKCPTLVCNKSRDFFSKKSTQSCKLLQVSTHIF